MNNSNVYVGQLVELIDHLGQAVNRETNLLTEKRPRDLEQFAEERERLTSAYQEEVMSIKSNPTLLQGASEDARIKLKLAMKEFHDLLNEHRRAVFAAKTVTQRLISSISREVSKRDRPVAGYNQHAQGPQAATNRRGRPVSLALNEVV